MKKDDQKNFVIFAVLAALILFGWPQITHWIFPQQQPASVKIEGGKTKPVANAGTDPAADSPKALRDRQVVLAETPRVQIETPSLRGSINLKGARIDDLVLTQYAETVAKNSPPIHLLSPSGAKGAYFAQFGWQGAGAETPDANTIWQASGPRLTPTTPVTLTSQSATGQLFRIELSVDENYMFSIRQTVANNGSAPVSITPFALISRAERSADPDQWAAHVGPIASAGGAAKYVNWKDVDAEAQQFATTGGWVGYTDHYWLTALVPDQRVPVALQQRPTPAKGYQADYQLSDPINLAPGKKVTYNSRFFAGAKEVKLLDKYQDELGIVKFGHAIDWGWYGVIEQPIFYYLDWLFRLVGNFGVAIILLTITIRLLLFPIAQRQFASMAAMRAVQPKMKALQERYKDDKQRQQQEIMKLYKEEKVNPLAGCLPILIQIPIMFALYKVLLLTIEMRHQPFVAWIRDLSAPDPLTPLNLFGLLNFAPPTFIAIGVIPILLGISMYFQFKLNPAPMDDMQKQIFSIMPWMMMFLMAPFAVGLQVYWITSNVLTIGQQWLLYKKHPALKEPIKKDPPKKEAKAK
ncbi:YidC/Oxa1 family membrane protein insertase [Sphingomonas naasensis]|uniref:membrane protein insertase YidC n=1 Tax=Sphingomonas naasensis TaxID=1344951 RepID=UPI001F0EFE24|nr:membrane protein insertase YidC [Sphingomonas naasensis]NIJ19248.1 YidC/Oxa1 family membrane protein insertase [Sphingomonas naasensis]